MPKTATPRKPETVSSKLAETRAKSKNRSLSSLLGIGDNEKRLATDLGSGLNDVIGRGTIAGLLGLPGDLGGAAENGLRSLLGLPQVVPYGGSEHIGQKMEEAGLVSNVRRPKTELLASLISPAQAATAGYKAPQMARAGVKALDNLSAPRTMGRQQGAIENLWHGSPHTFDRFDLSKIGTGEGAQAYGHGAYLAESPDVGKAYAENLTYQDSIKGSKWVAPDESPESAVAVDYLSSLRGMWEPADINKAVRERLQENEHALRFKTGGDPAMVSTIQAEIDSDKAVLSALSKHGLNAFKPNQGNIYQTRLAWPDAREATDPLSPDHFLHWDKPIPEHPESVRAAVAKAWTGKFPDVNYDDAFRQLSDPSNTVTGEGLQFRFSFLNNDNHSDVSNRLRDAGIPGIRYLDGGSRGAGAGSHNYVVFDDKLIDIVSRNGQPVK